eukprot:TRINITY_DN26187_c0_g2_i1.p1 TRINITY_DN26187_c0_g2~~TRINITY_DN26187_c0_g2_i1.p1  ORF type:complete len:514 (-),score=72.03 TRINITY_DN26187_c0_g2_i1:545-2086(-)
MPWELWVHTSRGVRTECFEEEAEAARRLRTTIRSCVLFDPHGVPLRERRGLFDPVGRRVAEVIAAREEATCGGVHGERASRWILGSHIRHAVRWETFDSEADARRRFLAVWWSKVLFHPSGRVVASRNATFDGRGLGVAAILSSYRVRAPRLVDPPASSPQSGTTSVRWRSTTSNEIGSFVAFRGEEALGIQCAIEASLHEDTRERMRLSLQETSGDLKMGREAEPLIQSNNIDVHFLAVSVDDLMQQMARHMEGLEDFDYEALSIRNANGELLKDWPTDEDSFPMDVKYNAPQQPAQRSCVPLQMLDHTLLLEGIYASQGLDFESVRGQAQRLLERLQLRPLDMGARNQDENGRTILNQCFYLCLARGYLGHMVGMREVSNFALQLKRAIEAAVIRERPAWRREVGEQMMAFADFLPVAMNASSEHRTLLAQMAVCVVDSTIGNVDAYLGPEYQSLGDEATKQQNLILLWYTPGHYQVLVRADDLGTKSQMAYDEFKDLLIAHGVTYVETLE